MNTIDDADMVTVVVRDDTTEHRFVESAREMEDISDDDDLFDGVSIDSAGMYWLWLMMI
jgi:hypothetical protein